MKRNAKIFVAGHRGLVGSAIFRRLESDGYNNLVVRTRRELDLTSQSEVSAFFEVEKPKYVFLAAARVGGIWANSTYPAEFIHQNLLIQINVIHSAYVHGVSKLLFLGSSCIYPRKCPQPMREEYLLTAPLEPTNEAYAISKIAGIKMCQFYHQQYGTDFISVMPTNLFGPGDNFDLTTSHVLPALIRKFHLAKLASKGDWEEMATDASLFGEIPQDIIARLIAIAQSQGHPIPNSLKPQAARVTTTPAITLWGTGRPRREFLYVDDLADACLSIMTHADASWLRGQGISHLNIGTGSDVSISELAHMVKEIVGYEGEIAYDTTKPDGMPQKMLDVGRLASLGWRHRTSLREGIQKSYTWYLEHCRA
ncbi:MAG: GDP-L-fucose synthase, partial [Thermodesulfobacteriota bacterium]|nr:GDP-L-fucose synthase [Thermodesulfobacteriota bacterium]